MSEGGAGPRRLLADEELRALAALEAVKLPLRGTSDRAAQEVRSCHGCGICCEYPRNEMKATPLEALAVAVRLMEDPQLAPQLAELRERIEAAIDRYGLREVEDDGRTYTCPFLDSDKRCRVHGAGQPVACVVFVPLTREHCDFRWEQVEEAGAATGRLNNELYGEDEWPVHALPVAVLAALRDLETRRALAEEDVHTSG